MASRRHLSVSVGYPAWFKVYENRTSQRRTIVPMGTWRVGRPPQVSRRRWAFSGSL